MTTGKPVTAGKPVGSMAELLGQLKDRVRDSLKHEYTLADQFPPEFKATKLKKAAQIKKWAETGQAACLQLAKGQSTGVKNPKELLSSQQDDLEAVRRQFGHVASAAAVGADEAQEAVVRFDEWKDTRGYLAWETFVELQGGKAKHAREVVAAQAKVKVYQDCTGKATAMAVAERNRYPDGPNGAVGTVIAGLVDSVSGYACVGASGPPKSHPVMDELLAGVAQVEEWPVNVCGEVAAMIDYLEERKIKQVADIPEGALFSHAETWDATARKWKGRSACGNCGTWLDKIGANRA